MVGALQRSLSGKGRKKKIGNALARGREDVVALAKVRTFGGRTTKIQAIKEARMSLLQLL